MSKRMRMPTRKEMQNVVHYPTVDGVNFCAGTRNLSHAGSPQSQVAGVRVGDPGYEMPEEVTCERCLARIEKNRAKVGLS